MIDLGACLPFSSLINLSRAGDRKPLHLPRVAAFQEPSCSLEELSLVQEARRLPGLHPHASLVHAGAGGVILFARNYSTPEQVGGRFPDKQPVFPCFLS